MTKPIKISLWFLLLAACSLQLTSFANEPQLVIDPITKRIYVTTGDATTTPVVQEQSTGNNFNFADNYISATGADTQNNTEGQTWDTDNETNEEDTPPTIQIETEWLTEFEQALARMYANGLTQYDTAETYRPADGLTREEAAKIIGEAYRKLGYPTETKNENCSFADADKFDPTLVTNIEDVCTWWLFQGSAWNFLPTESMTKWQALAVLIRMLEGKKSEEIGAVRWDIYHKKWLTIGITQDPRVELFDQPITREEIALFVWRVKNIVENEQLRVFSLNTMGQIDGDTTGTQSISNEQHLQSLASGIDLANDPELQEAINWMYENGFTVHQTAKEFNPFTLTTREQAAKIIDIFAGLYGGGEITLLPESSCTFSDLGDTPDDLIPHIISACRQWLIVGAGSTFNPKGTMSKAQFIVALVRLLEGKQLDERVNPRWKNYFELARSLEIVGPGDVITFDNAITRYEVAIFLYRFKVKYLILKNLNNSRLPNEIVSMVSDSVSTGVNNLPEWEVFVNTPLLSDNNFSVWYIDVFGTRQKIVRTSRESFFSNNLVWYGDIFDMETDEKIWTVTFIIGNGFLIEWTMRYTNATRDFIITAIPGKQSTYAIRTVQRGGWETVAIDDLAEAANTEGDIEDESDEEQDDSDTTTWSVDTGTGTVQ